MSTYESRTLAIAIERPPDDVYAFAMELENLPKWAAGLGSTGHRDGDAWVSDTNQGSVRVQFVTHNQLGVLDHHVTLADGTVLYSPMRVIANGSGSHVSFTLYRLAGVTAEAFAADAGLIEADLKTLKMLMESS